MNVTVNQLVIKQLTTFLPPPIHFSNQLYPLRRSFVSFLNQQIDKNRLKSSNAGTSITTLTSDERKPMQQVPRPATMAIAPIVATTKARQPMITTTSSPPQKLKAIARKMYNAGQDVTISPSMAVGSTPGSSARPQSVNRAREAPIKPLLYAQQQESLPPQPYQQLAKVYPPPNRPGATAIPTVWPLPSSSDSMAWSVSRSYSSSTHFSSAPTKPNKAKRTLPPQLKQIDRRKNTNSSPSAAWPFGPAALRLQPARRHLQAVHMAGGLAAMGVERLSSPGMERDGKEMETIAHTLLSLASASPEYSSAITGHGPEGRGKKKCGTGVTSAPSQEQQCIQI